MAKIVINPNYVESGDAKQLGKYQFVAEQGSTPEDLVVWLEKSKANEKHPEGKPWIRLPKDNCTNRAYFSEDLFLATAVEGSVEVEVKTAAPRVLGATGVKQEIVEHLSETDAAEYTGLVNRALEAFKNAKAAAKPKQPQEMSIEELEAYVAALKAGQKYEPAAAPKSFLDMFDEAGYARYNELLALSAENKANAPKTPRAPLTPEQKQQRQVKRVQTEISKAEALLQSLRAVSAKQAAQQASDEEPEGDDYVDEE